MATIVLVHGIAQEQKSADTLEEEWLPDLAGGVRTAGFAEIADRLYRLRSGSDGIDTRMAFYGDLFLRGDQQGLEPGDLSGPERALAEQLAMEWTARAASRSTDEKSRRAASQELAQLQQTAGEEQGARAAARSAINSLARIRWFAPFGMGFATRFVMRSLTQVTRYLSDDVVREQALARVHAVLTPGTRVLIGHSLGSIVAFEAVQRFDHPLPLLITIGCPLGLRTVVYERVRPQPPRFPPVVHRWVNIADRNDIVAAEPDLTPLFGSTAPPGAVLEGGYTADNGAKPHQADFYLTKAQVGRPIGALFSGTG
jgi:pimeloyl-ACP methyl ester carboxylesterase